MAKLTLTDVAAGYGLVTTLNANHALIETALENTLSRDGTTPNTMSANLDMNSQYIVNLATPANDYDAATKKYIDDTALAVSNASGTFSEALAYNFTNQIDFAAAGGIRVQDAGATDYAQLSHDGTDFAFALTNTTDLNFTGGTEYTFDNDVRTYNNNVYLSNDAGDADWCGFGHTGTFGTLYTGGANNHKLRINAANGNAPIEMWGDGILIFEQTAASADAAGWGQLWVKDNAPNDLYFTDDTGQDIQITSNGALNEQASTVAKAVKTADESITNDSTSTTDSDLAGMTITNADKWYLVEGMIYTSQVSSTPDFKMNFIFSQTPQDSRMSLIQTSSLATTMLGYSAGMVTSTALAQTALAVHIIHLKGMFKSNASTPGTLGLQWAQNTSDANATTLQAGSWLRIEQLD